MYYPDEIVEEVRMKNDIVDIISGYVRLQKKGSNYFGLCPFHNEKSPSFSVSAGKQMYYCFGCGAGGNVITFLMEYENYTFQEALKSLADRAGVRLPEQDRSREAREQADLRSRILEVNKLAANYFYYQLSQPSGQAGYRYLKDRRLADATIRHFGLGFANKTSSDLYQFLKAKGYEDGLLKETGLVSIEERGAYDKFWNRVMFPILDVNNRVIGFGGRVMGDGTPKYLNSPETKVFDKSRSLYGLNFARTSREKYMLVCEGYMDVIALHQAGFNNAVASLGTAFTLQHANLVKRYAQKVVLTYDSDGAGVKAALRAIPILRDAGLSVQVLDMKPYKDPDEFIQNLGADAFRQRIEEARNSFLYEIDALQKGYSMQDPEQKTEFYRQVAQKLLVFTEALERDNYLQAVSQEYMIDYESLRRLVNQMGSQVGAGGPPRPEGYRERREKIKREKEDGPRRSQRLLLTWLIEDPELFPAVQGILTPDDFKEELYHQVAGMVWEALSKGAVEPAGILNRFINDEEQYREVARLFHTSLQEELGPEERQKAWEETVRKVKRYSLDYDSRHVTDIEGLQKIIRAQKELSTLQIAYK